jgi:hypothetical protein
MPPGPPCFIPTYLGGKGCNITANYPWYGDVGFGIATDSSGNAYVTGWTCSPDFPTLKPIEAYCANYDDMCTSVFVTNLNASGSALLYSTYLDANSSWLGTPAQGNSIAVDCVSPKVDSFGNPMGCKIVWG